MKRFATLTALVAFATAAQAAPETYVIDSSNTASLFSYRARRVVEACMAVAGISIVLVLFLYFAFGKMSATPTGEQQEMSQSEMLENEMVQNGMAMGESVVGASGYSGRLVSQDQIVPGALIPLEVQIFDPSGNPVSSFEPGSFGKYTYYAYVAVVSRDLASFQAEPVLVDPYAGVKSKSSNGVGMSNMGGMETPAPTSVAPTAVTSEAGDQAVSILPKIQFPKDGQYVVFVDFQPAGAERMSLALPVDVGGVETKASVPLSHAELTQKNGDLMLTLKNDGDITAGQPEVISFEVADSQGAPISGEIGLMSGSHLAVHVIDEKLTTYLRPEVLDSSTLQYSINFPGPGLYRVWLEYMYGSTSQQTAFVVEVK